MKLLHITGFISILWRKIKLKIVKCVSTIEEFSPVDFKKLNIGVEIQDFVEPNLKEIEIEKLVSQYKTLLRDFPYTKSLHGPFLDLKPVSPDEDIRNISYKKNILEH